MQRFPIVRDGILAGLSATRETAPLLGWERSNGCSRADGFAIAARPAMTQAGSGGKISTP